MPLEPSRDQIAGRRAVATLNRHVAARAWQTRNCLTAKVSGARLMLTCGLPGAGKTALAMQLAADRSALRVTKDEWLMALGSNPWDEPTRVKLEHELSHLAQEVLRLDLSVVLDFGLWTRSERDEFRAAARGLGVGVELHYLDVPTDELWRRIQARNAEPPWDSYPIGRSHLDEWAALFQAPDAAELALFDPPPRSE
ncbi:MAG TPA: ATP-binding protein [Desertimonas sp.]|nr:ATP-binding protein [Desertimonas sp.]